MSGLVHALRAFPRPDLRVAVILLTMTAAADAQSIDELYVAAKPEGRVVFGGAIKESAADELTRAFGKRYPGVQLNYTRRSSEPMVQMVEADKLAGKVSFDLLNLTEPADILRWQKEGFLAKVPMPALTEKMLPGTFDTDGYFHSIGVTPMYGVYNTKMLKPDTAPRSLKTLLTDPKWVGRIAASRPVRGGTSTGALMAAANAVGPDVLLKTAPDLKILLTRGNEAALSAVSSGERWVSWGVSGYRALEAMQDGDPIELIFWEEGVTLAHFSGVIPAKAPHPNAGRLLLAWLLSDEGQAIVVRTGNFYSPLKGFKTTPGGQPPLEKVKLADFSFEKVVNEGNKLAQAFDKAVGLK